MNLAGRIRRLEKALGEPDAPKLIVISTASDRHATNRVKPDYLWLRVPWHDGYVHGGDGDPLDALTDEQRALIGPHDKVVGLCLSPNGMERSGDESPVSDGRDSP